MFHIPSLPPSEAFERHKKGDIIILDVREPEEVSFTSIEGTLNIPISEFPQKFSELEGIKDRPIAVLCRTGSRSAQVTMFLKQHGFKDVYNIAGGIFRWSDEVDPTIKKYQHFGRTVVEIT